METAKEPCRVRINQPSTLQNFNHLHGKIGIAVNGDYHSNLVRVCFTEGSIISMILPRTCLDYI